MHRVLARQVVHHYGVAGLMEGRTGADLENLLNEAALLSGRRNEPVIRQKTIQESIIKVIAGPEKHSRVIPEQERKGPSGSPPGP